MVSRFNGDIASQESGLGQLDKHRKRPCRVRSGRFSVDVVQIPSITRTKVFQSHVNLYLRGNPANLESIWMKTTICIDLSCYKYNKIDID